LHCGSAAFNLFVIIAICIASIPQNESRKIADFEVFAVTAFFSVFAYLWLAAVLIIFSPDVVTLIEAIVTFLFFPLFVALAYATDKNWLPHQRKRMLLGQMVELEDTNGVLVSKEKLALIVKDIDQRYGANLDQELRMKLVCNEILNAGKGPEPRSRAYYRINATREMTGGKKKAKGSKEAEARKSGLQDSAGLQELNIKLKQPIGILTQCAGNPPLTTVSVCKVEPHARDAGVEEGDKIDFINGVSTKKMTTMTVQRLLKKECVFLTLSRPADARSDVQGKHTTLQFSSEFYAYMENAGSAQLKVVRGGCLDGPVSVHYYTEDGTAKDGVRYESQTGVVVLMDGQVEAEILIPLIDDEIWQDVEDFRVVLWCAEHPALCMCTTHQDPTGCLPQDVSLVIGSAGLEIANPDTETTVQIAVPQGKPLSCIWSWEQIGHIGAVEQQEVLGLNEGISIVHVTCEGAGTFMFKCADFAHASSIAENMYRMSRPVYGQYDQSNKILEHKFARQESHRGGNGLRRQESSFIKTSPETSKSNQVDLGEFAECVVQVINDDSPGIIAFEHDVMNVKEDGGKCKVGIRRTMGASCKVTCLYATKDGSAVGGKDFMHTEGTITFEKNEEHKFIEVDIVHSDHVERDEHFLVVLTDATHGASFDTNTDGGTTRCLCKVNITEDGGALMGFGSHLAAMLINKDKLQHSAETWGGACADAWICHAGEDDDGNELPITTGTYLVHYIALPWKLLFCVVPPTDMAGGWACFYMALCMTGFVTIIIGDLASVFGCVLGLEDSITAITFVALGTSLPDAFASKAAATGDPTADAAIGNVTGSNSVNVFLGLGLPWVIGAVYWGEMKATDDWVETYPEIAKVYPGGGFAVPAGDLAFSVIVFALLAISAICMLYYRRKRFGAELGGAEGPKMQHAAVFVGMWLTYVCMSIAKVYKFI
jgi:Ca2+/Na+ antiporter